MASVVRCGGLVGRDAMRGEDLLAELRTWLAGRLPAYMQPTAWQLLSSLPLNANGKLDRKALPKVDAAARRQAGEPPAGGARTFGRSDLGGAARCRGHRPRRALFELGGHSLSATRVVSRLRQDLELDVPLRVLFERPVLADFAASLESQAASAAPVLQYCRESPSCLCRMLSNACGSSGNWSLKARPIISPAYCVRGVLDRAALQQAFDWLVLRHETLRTRFEEVDGQARQTILANMPLRIVLEDCAGASEATLRQRVAEEIRQPFDLARGPLLRVRLLALAGQEHVLVITQHHIVSDGWSMQVMVDELLQAYAAARRGEQRWRH